MKTHTQISHNNVHKQLKTCQFPSNYLPIADNLILGLSGKVYEVLANGSHRRRKDLEERTN
mgnify:CR=1 FL=1